MLNIANLKSAVGCLNDVLDLLTFHETPELWNDAKALRDGLVARIAAETVVEVDHLDKCSEVDARKWGDGE